jgi:hypothetical protein
MSVERASTVTVSAEELAKVLEPMMRRIVREELVAYVVRPVEPIPVDVQMAVNGKSAEKPQVAPANLQNTSLPPDSPQIEWADKRALSEEMNKLMQALGIPEGKLIGAKALRELIRQEGILEENELSRGIIEMREEKLGARGLS